MAEMREILFRGKRIDNGEWETGSLVINRMGCSDEQVYIADKMTAYNTPVSVSSVGQYTGLTDKNGKKIFEGDILSSDLSRTYNIVVYKNGAFMEECEDGGHIFYDIFFSCDDESKEFYPYAEVIGNIHDGGFEVDKNSEKN